jgi:hypothetical protein
MPDSTVPAERRNAGVAAGSLQGRKESWDQRWTFCSRGCGGRVDVGPPALGCAAGRVFTVVEDEERLRPSRRRGQAGGAPLAASLRPPARGMKVAPQAAGEEQVRAAADVGVGEGKARGRRRAFVEQACSLPAWWGGLDRER